MAEGVIDFRQKREETLIERRLQATRKAKAMKERGHSNVTIARELGLAESTVRLMLRSSV
jgi:hypothetical protein